MAFMNFLRALVDLGLYFSIAGMFSTIAGGQLAIEAFLLLSACFALSFSLRRSRAARLAALAPALLLFLLPVPIADFIVCIPPVGYLLYLVWTDGYQLSWSRQVDIFSLFWKAFLVAAILLTLLGSWKEVLSAGIPIALLTGAASVLLTRSLRHEAAVYLQPGYQTVNFVSIILLALAALVLGSEWALRAVVFVAGSFYSHVIAPLFVGAAMLIGLILMCFFPLIQWLVDVFMGPRDAPSVELPSEEGFQDQLDKLERTLPAFSVELVIEIIVAVAVVVVLVLLFRWMARRQQDAQSITDPNRADIPRRAEAEHVRPGSYAYRIRRQYRAFLRLCRSKGLQFPLSYTSTDVGEKSLGTFPDEDAMCALRDIYQQARYQGEASKEDYQRFKRQLAALKKVQTSGGAD